MKADGKVWTSRKKKGSSLLKGTEAWTKTHWNFSPGNSARQATCSLARSRESGLQAPRLQSRRQSQPVAASYSALLWKLPPAKCQHRGGSSGSTSPSSPATAPGIFIYLTLSHCASPLQHSSYRPSSGPCCCLQCRWWMACHFDFHPPKLDLHVI